MLKISQAMPEFRLEDPSLDGALCGPPLTTGLSLLHVAVKIRERKSRPQLLRHEENR